jgi:hypothetical protein
MDHDTFIMTIIAIAVFGKIIAPLLLIVLIWLSA